MKLLLIGDPHFKVKNSKQTYEFRSKLNAYLNLHPVDVIVIMGDIHDTHESIDLVPYCQITDWIQELSCKFLTYILVGNHDRKNNREFLTREHSMYAHEAWNRDNPNLRIFSTVEEVVLEDQDGQIRIIFVPYVPNGRFMEALSTIPDWQGANLILAHQEFKGCQMGAKVSEEGDVWSLDYPPVYSGHVHTHQILDNGVTYVGSSLQQNFGEMDIKTLSLLQTVRDEDSSGISKISFLHSRVNLGCTRYMTYHISSEEVNNFVVPPRISAKIKISGTQAQLKAVRQGLKYREWCKLGHVVALCAVNEARYVVDPQNKPPDFIEILTDRAQRSPPGVKELLNYHFGLKL